MRPNFSNTHILAWLVPETLAVIAGVVCLGWMRAISPGEGHFATPRTRILSSIGLLSCALPGAYSVLIGGTWNGLMLAEPFELSGAISFIILIFQPNLIAKSRLRTFLAICVALSVFVAVVSMRDAWYLSH